MFIYYLLLQNDKITKSEFKLYLKYIFQIVVTGLKKLIKWIENKHI